MISVVLDTPNIPSLFTANAKRTFRYVVPDEWYRRSKSRSLSSVTREPSVSTLKKVQDPFSSEDEDEGTAKKKDVSSPRPVGSGQSDWRSSLSPSRFSSIFEGWVRPATPTSPTKADAVMTPSVSEPTLVRRTSNAGTGPSRRDDDIADEDLDTQDFEEMLVCEEYTIVSFLVTQAIIERSGSEGASARRDATFTVRSKEISIRATSVISYGVPLESADIGDAAAIVLCYLRSIWCYQYAYTNRSGSQDSRGGAATSTADHWRSLVQLVQVGRWG